LAGILFALVALELGLRAGGSIYRWRIDRFNRQAVLSGGYRILCIGESTTSGEYPQYLAGYLKELSGGQEFVVIDAGVPGINTSDILNSIEKNIQRYRPDMVISMMGINDTGLHYPLNPVGLDSSPKIFRNCRVYKLWKILQEHIGRRSPYNYKLWIPSASDSPREGKKNHPENNYLREGIEKRNLGEYLAAEMAFLESIEKFSEDERAYIELGWLYNGQEKFLEAERVFASLESLQDPSPAQYMASGGFYIQRGKYEEAVKILEKGIKKYPTEEGLLNDLGLIYFKLDQLDKSEKIYRKIIELNPGDPRGYYFLSRIFGQKKDDFGAQIFWQDAEKLSASHMNQITLNNYRKVRDILREKNIVYLCAQYPGRSIEPLKKIFHGNEEGIIFADNSRLFREAVLSEGYEEYFRDSFAGDFGHCTEKGNRLLARNLAEIIAKAFIGD
ncbi:MAG: tetratricopeptide repeat protein, partial [Elusimicrobia bacterium]|nr:tetratricopeptide repeat protein [Elusimicrobiota bacterium]